MTYAPCRFSVLSPSFRRMAYPIQWGVTFLAYSSPYRSMNAALIALIERPRCVAADHRFFTGLAHSPKSCAPVDNGFYRTSPARATVAYFTYAPSDGGFPIVFRCHHKMPILAALHNALQHICHTRMSSIPVDWAL